MSVGTIDSTEHSAVPVERYESRVVDDAELQQAATLFSQMLTACVKDVTGQTTLTPDAVSLACLPQSVAGLEADSSEVVDRILEECDGSRESLLYYLQGFIDNNADYQPQTVQ